MEVLLEAFAKLKIQADKAQGPECDSYIGGTGISSYGNMEIPDSDQGYHYNVQGSGRLYGPLEYEDYHVVILFGMLMFYIGEIFNAN